MKIDICICTFRRAFVVETLRSVDQADKPAAAEVSIIVVDNDEIPSAADRVAGVAADLAIPVRYIHQPGANISIARNAGLAASQADWIVFLDDDEWVDAGWLMALLARQAETGADAIFGHSHAVYGDTAPGWMVKGNFHSQFAAPRGDVVETGHTCNALLRWAGAPWQEERFEIERGRSGGEDTEFFFRLHRMGAQYAIADDAIVREDVPESRAQLTWLLQRRFRIGQSYAASALTPVDRVVLFGKAFVKASYSYARAGGAMFAIERRAFWLMRGTMHAGVCAGCLHMRQSALYGG